MLVIYNGASICAFEQPFECNLRLQPHLKNIMAKSRDWDELQYVWTEWRRKSGRNMRELFEQMVDLTNDGAKYNSKFYTTLTHIVFKFIFNFFLNRFFKC